MRTILLLLLLMGLPSLTAVEGPEAVPGAEIRDQLANDKAPWYDRDSDGWKRITTRQPTESKNPGLDRPDGSGLLPTLALVIVFAVVILAVVALIRWISQDQVLSRDMPRREAAPPPPDLSVLPLPAEELVAGDPEQHLAAALGAGDGRRAAIWLHACVLLRCHALGLIRLERGRTNGAYVRELGPSPVMQGLFTDTAAAFESSYFGGQVLAIDMLQGLAGRYRAQRLERRR